MCYNVHASVQEFYQLLQCAFDSCNKLLASPLSLTAEQAIYVVLLCQFFSSPTSRQVISIKF